MSGAIQKLEQLLSRVQQRRVQPRALEAAPAERRSLQTTDAPFSAPPPSTGRVSKAPGLTPLEESMEQVVPVERPRESVPGAFDKKPAPVQPDSEELVLDDFEPAGAPTIQPGVLSAPPVPMPAQPAPAPAPAAVMAAPVPITAATARIAPAAPMASASPVSTLSKARNIEPKSFGELLDLSLALRPSK